MQISSTSRARLVVASVSGGKDSDHIRVMQDRGDEVVSAVTVAGGTTGVEKSHPYIKGYRGKTVSGDKRRAIPLHVHDEGVRSRSDADLPPSLLTVQDLAVLLATSSSGVYSRVARGQVPGALRIGRSLRFDPRVIAQWLSANKASAGGLL